MFDGDEEAIEAYSRWLRHLGNGASPDAPIPDARVFDIPEIRHAAQDAVRGLTEYVVVGRPSSDPLFKTIRLSIGASANNYKALFSVWKGDRSITELFLQHVRMDDSNEYRGGLLCLDGVPLDQTESLSVKEEILRKISLFEAGMAGRYRFEVLVGLRWLQRNGFGSDADVIRIMTELYERQPRLRPAACALLLQMLPSDEAQRRSIAVSAEAIGLPREDLSDAELLDLVSVAPDAWCDALKQYILRHTPPDPAAFVRVISALPMSHRIQAAMDVFAAAVAWPIPWTEDERVPSGRPSDVARMVVFEAGLDSRLM